MWDKFFNDFQTPMEHRELTPRSKVSDNGNSIALELELPGVKKENIKVEVENSVLSITASRKAEVKEEGKDVFFNEISYGEYKRNFRLSEDVDHLNINAAYENGILKLELAKKEKAKPQQITVK